ncbi:MAG: EamA family transporter [Chitinophagaceae bacterium]
MTGTIKKNASTLMVVLAFATVYIVWGSTYLFIQKAVFGFPPFLLGAVRFLLAGLLLMAWCRFKGEQLFVLKNIRDAAVSGILLLFIGNGIVIWVEQFMPTAMVAITLSSSPLWFIVLDKAKWGENFKSKATIAGLIIGFAGVILLFGENIHSILTSVGNKAELLGLALLVIGSIAWSAGSLYSKYKASSGSTSVNTAWQMIAAGLAFVPISLFNGDAQHLQWQKIPTSAWFALVYLVFFGSILAYSAYVWLLQVRSATQVSTYAYVNPVVAVLLGILFANEHITWVQITGLAIILGSVLLISLAKYRSGESKAAIEKAVSNKNVEKSFSSVPAHKLHQGV